MLRSYNHENILTPNTVLPAGTEIKIPDSYIDAHYTGDKRDEVSLLNWIANAQSLSLRRFNRGGKIKRDYFVHVNVPGKKINGWITLRSLARRGGLDIVTTEDAPVINDEVLAEIQVQGKKRNLDDAYFQNGPRLDEKCYHPSFVEESKVIQKLAQQTREIIDELNQSIDLKREDNVSNRGDAQDIKNNFNKTCRPIKFNNFLTEVKRVAQENNIPGELLLGLMTQESSGNCNTVYNERNGSNSLGLFQINTGSTQKRMCRVSRENIQKRQCLQNPITNLEEAAKILISKYKSVNSHKPDNQSGKSLDEMGMERRDLWRKAISAYNGGEGHVFQGYYDIQKFNQQFGEDLNPHDWRVRKLFMMRRSIEKQGGKLLKSDSGYRYRRNTRNTLHNLSYVESVIPAEHIEKSNSQAFKWMDTLYP